MPHRVADPGVAPACVLYRHPDHEVFDLLVLPRSPWPPLLAAVVLPGDQAPVPAQNRVRCDQAAQLLEGLPAEFASLHRESPALVLGEADALAAEQLPQDFVLLPEVVNGLLLLAVEPAGQRRDEEMERCDLHAETLSRCPNLAESPGATNQGRRPRNQASR